MPINFAVKLAATVALEAASMALQATKKTTGPRLDELTVTVADFGTPIPRFLGERRFACPVFHAEDLKEVQHSTKVKGGGKQTTFSYLATFACAIADNAIDKVLKIFFDDKLVYDATGPGPISYASSLGIDLNTVMRIYKGTEDQLPDPRYVTFCEDKYGPDSAPAYRGVSYLFFEELPVDNFGNRIPQISVIAVSAAAASYPYETIASTQSTTANFSFSPTASWAAYTDSSGQIEWLDAPTRTVIAESPAPGLANGLVTNAALDDDGTAYMVGPDLGTPSKLWLCTVAPAGAPVLAEIVSPASKVCSVTRVFHGASYTAYSDQDGYIAGSTAVPDSLGARDFCTDGTENDPDWGVFQPDGASSSFTIKNLTSGEAHSFTGTSRSDRTQARICYVESTGKFMVTTDGNFYLIDKATWTVTASGTAAWGTAELPADRPSATSFYDGYNQYSLDDGSLIRTIDPTSFFTPISGHAQTYDPVNNAIWQRSAGFGTDVDILYLDRAGNAGTTLGAIVSKMCDAAGLIDRDTTLLTQPVAGYSWTRGDVKSQMEPALDIHDVDARPHDWTIDFLPRGSAPVGAILTQDFAKSGDNARYRVTIAQDTDLPKLLRVNFADTEFDQQTNNVLSPMPVDSVDTQRDDVIDLTTYADTPTGAQQKADRYMRRQWNSRETIENSLTNQNLALEPGDVTTLWLDDIGQNARLTKQTIVGGQIDCTFIRDETNFASVNAATTGQSLEARTHQVITFPAPVRGFVIDAPYREDADADVRPLLYASAGSYASLAYPGAVIFEATGDPPVYDTLFATIPSGATWGLCSAALGNANPNIWDRGNTLTVSLQFGSLSSVSEADIDADPTLNLIMIGSTAGWEYVNFTTATLNVDGTYTLSGFKRGRRGTEWMCNAHALGEAWVLASSLDVEEMGTDQIGGNLSFKAQAIGRSLDSAPAITIEPYTGASLTPYAPARVRWQFDGTDLQATIYRRTRVGGSWTTTSWAVSLGESSEAYEVDIVVGGSVVRTISVSGTNTFAYTAAMAAADGVTLPTPPPVNAYQMSSVVGRGFALAA
jgi:hypothetical protein